ncbi:hypothetical protein FOMPIDRAFT_1110572, partial [Fomitopsis schrenkii]
MFLERWDAILAIAPPSVTEYLRSYWIPYRKWWSAVSRVGRNIWEANNTNMLLEAYHHVLKGKFLEGKRNHRVDHLLYTLIKNLIPYYAFRLRRQCFDFEGPDLEVMERKKIVQDAS